MNILFLSLTCLVALLHILFFVLEMFLWSKPYGRKVFGLTEEFASQSKTLAANQGLYNGLLAVCLIWGVVKGAEATEFTLLLLTCVVIAGIYGAWSVKKTIFWVQAFPAILAISCYLAERTI